MNDQDNALIIHTDGGSRGNPGPAAIGVIANIGKQQLFTLSEYIGINTNNFAEYSAVLFALKKIIELKPAVNEIHFILDSELVIKQINGEYRVKDIHLIKLYAQIENLLKLLSKEKIITFSHTLRSGNKEADNLVNLALDNHRP